MVKPKKHLGQHFLTDPGIAERIVKALEPAERTLMEVGPGKGILTRAILSQGNREFFVVEIDDESVDYLHEHFGELQGRIIHQDFLKLDISASFEGDLSIIGNFPYNISSQILFRALQFKDQVVELVGMFQKEVAERVVSPPGSKKYGILSVLVQAYYDTELLFQVNEGSFFPPPRVKSAVIRLTRKPDYHLACDEGRFAELVKSAFNQRRKTLRNALKKFDFEPGTEEMLQLRAEQLAVKDFVALTAALKDQS